MTTTQEKNNKPSLLRILNGAAIAVIALSVLAQCIGLGIALSGGAEKAALGLVLAFGYSSFAIAPGMLLAFVKFLLNAIRSVKDEKARIKTVVYLVITLWPLGVSRFMLGGAIATMPESASTMPRHAPRETPKSAQFLAGVDWAKENLPSKASQCKGSLQFIKGCRNYFGEHLAKPKPAGQGRYEEMTTAECKAEVNANYEALTQEFLENGNPRGAEVTRRRSWYPELQDCENYDKLVENTFMPKAYNRLQHLLDKMKAGEAVTEDEKAVILKDFAEMSKVSDQPYKTAYFEKTNEYFERLNGQYKEPVTVYPKISCEEYQAKIDEMINLDKERVAAMQAFKRADGITDGGRRNGVTYNDLNQQRIDMLWDWKYYTDGAKAAGCQIKTN